MATGSIRHCSSSFVLLLFLLQLLSGYGELQSNYYAEGCSNAEEIIEQEVAKLYDEHGNTAVSWIRNLFHDCMVQSCNASLLLESKHGNRIVSEHASSRSFGKRNFKYGTEIKEALERECPATVSCTDIIVRLARDSIVLLGGPRIKMRSGRRDGRESHATVVEELIPNHNDSMALVLSRFESIGVAT